MRYPRQQAEIVGLVDQIISGVTEHPGIFPHNDSASLQAARDEYEAASAALTNAKAQFLQAATVKQEKFLKMQQIMKNQIKIGTVDNVNTPENLSFIGWGTKRPPQQIDIPAPPTDLRITAQGNDGTLCLSWDKGRNNGGPVRSFIVERKAFVSQKAEDRRQKIEDGGRITEGEISNVQRRISNVEVKQRNEWSDWQLAGTCYDNQIKLIKQPIGIKLEYQIRAGNASGESCPSNAISVVL